MHDAELAGPVVVAPVVAVPHVGEAAHHRQADLLTRCADAHSRHRVGQRRGRRAVDAEVLAFERRLVLRPHQTADGDDLFELSEPHRCLREVVAVRQVLVLAPPCADAEDEAAPREHLQRRGHLRRQRRWAVAVAQHVMAELHVRVASSQPGECGPRFEKRVGLGIEPVEVVGDPHRVEVGQCRGQDVLVLEHHDRLVVAPPVADDGGEPAELQRMRHAASLAAFSWLRVPTSHDRGWPACPWSSSNRGAAPCRT